MKIAICISGILRNFRPCFESLQKYVLSQKDHSFDVFLSTWNSKIAHIKQNIPDVGTINDVLNAYQPIAYNYADYDADTRKRLYHDTKMDLFQQEVCSIEHPVRTNGRWKKLTKCSRCNHEGRNGSKCHCCGGDVVHNQIGMFYNIWKANFLKKQHELAQGFVYDCVVRTRFDNLFFSPFKEEYYKKMQTHVAVPEGFDAFLEFGGGINDQMAWSTSANMDVYSDTYLHLYNLALEYSQEHRRYGVPHAIINLQLEKNGIGIERPPLRYVLHYKRKKYQRKIQQVDHANIRI
jgi:hypothetical protein